MSRKRVPSYRLHKPSGQAVVTLGGRDHYLGQWGTEASRDEDDRLISEWLANGRRLPSENGHGDRTVAELLAAYWEFARDYYVKGGRPTKELSCMKQALRPLNSSYGETPIRGFGPLALKALRQKLIEAGYARTHINHQVNRIR